MSSDSPVAVPYNSSGTEIATASNPLRIDPTGSTTQPVSATALPLPTGAAQDSTLTGGTAKAIVRGGAKGTTTAADVTSTAEGTDHQALDVQIMHGGAAKDPTQIRALTSSDVVTAAQGTAAAASGGWPVKVTDGTNVLGTAGNPIRVDPTGSTTQPVSGSVTANIGTSGSLALDATLTGGTQKAIVRGGAKGTTVAADVTASSIDADHQALDVRVYGGGGGGSQQVEGRAAAGASPVGNPVYIGGTDGSLLRALLTDTVGRIVTAPAGSTSTSRGFTDGQVTLSATAVAAVRKTTYTEPTTNAQRSVASSSANDTNTAGTGARQVKITYFTSACAGPYTETVNLNGTSAVNTVATDICFIEKMEVVSVGSGGSNAGTITLYSTTAGGGTVVWTIAIGDNKTFGAHHYIASGQTCYITGQLVGIKGADTTSGYLRAKNPTLATSPEVQISDLLRAPSSGQSFRAYGTPIVVVGPARVIAYAAPDSTSSRTYYASFDSYEQAT